MPVTIGVPIYNEARFLSKTLSSISGQADRIIICDNASTDGSEKICRDFASRFPNVHYERFSKNKGAAASFRYCFDRSDTEYFMWVGGHDLLVKNYVKKLAYVLDSDSTILQAYSNALHLDVNYVYKSFYYYDWCDKLMSCSADIRVAATIKFLSDCTIFHGLYRRQILEDYFEKFHEKVSVENLPIDFVILSYVARHGKMKLVPNCNYIRIDPHSDETSLVEWKRVVEALDPELSPNPYYFPMGVYKGQKAILDELKAVPGCNHKILNEALALLDRWKNPKV